MSQLTTHQLTVRIANKLICNNLHFSVLPGETIGILGGNGSGKTTLLLTLAGLHPATVGEIFLHEKKLQTLSAKSIARQLGILFQDTLTPFSQTVFDSCCTGRYPHLRPFSFENTDDPSCVMRSLRIMALENQINQDCRTLSGGEKRRLAIATLLTQSPTIYLLDEPTNHLDLHHQLNVLNHFKQLTKIEKTSTIMSLHDIHLAERYCDKILMLFSHGEFLFGSTQQLINRTNLQRLYHCEFEHQANWIPTTIKFPKETSYDHTSIS